MRASNSDIKYVITSTDTEGGEVYWNGTWGWTVLGAAYVYTSSQKRKVSLPTNSAPVAWKALHTIKGSN